MLKLYGFSVSNYYNMVKLALLEKGLPFEEVPLRRANPEALAVSPRGKVPVLGVKQGFINETSVILEYLEQSQEGPALLPADRLRGHRCWRCAVRSSCTSNCLHGRVSPRLFGMSVPEAIKEKSRAELLLGIGTLGRHAKFAPYVAGESFTLADLYFMYSLNLACGVGEKLFGWTCWRSCRKRRRCWRA